ncbi:MFS transporter [Nocardioides gansuensis]|uniref:MFS transporter n=1 Tax=Nocardioides gansuensis TaxID=2138300 RepID=A0A2T8FD44_9ACTN|nr:MFS transporter [Nocardioides gansuensis]PVG83638.1 MFS transporter [Nocardioides gansuensis]
MSQVKRSLHPELVRGAALTVFGTLLIAATYGMARFGVGLLHPAMAVERPGVAAALPSAATAQFVSYCLAAGLAAPFVPRRSRVVAGVAGVVAGVGCLGLAVSTSAGWFVASAFVGGAGAGLASPALVGLLDAVVPPRLASAAQATVNAGTAVGVMGAGVLAGALDAPSVAWPIMAVLCLAPAAVVVVLTSGTVLADTPAPRTEGRMPNLTLPIAAAVGAGVISAAVWTYGPTEVVARGALEPGQVGLLWMALGLGGVAGAFIDGVVSRWGPRTAFLLFTATLVVGSIGVLAPNLGGWWWPLTGAAVFGAAYMALSGVLILWGRLLDPPRGAAITAWLFIALAIGQAIGAQALGSVFG